MNPFRKRTLVAVGAGALLLVGAGSALAAGYVGPPKTPPRAGLQQGGAGYGLMMGGVVMDAAAEYIGISESDLIAARHAGQSLAQIATAHGKSVPGLQAALTTAFKANLDKAVAAGRLTSDQAAAVLASFQTQIKTNIDRTTTGPVAGRGGMGMGLGLGMGRGSGACRS